MAAVPGSSCLENKDLGRHYGRFRFRKTDHTLDLAADLLRKDLA